ncbi:MAG: phosphate regulon sensor histidine kinase PhoR [Gammaproteobacteria bacterium]
MRTELWHIAVLAVAASLVGLGVGSVSLSLLVAAGTYGVWHLLQLRRLLLSIRYPKTRPFPDVRGIYQEIYSEIYRLRDRFKRRKKKLSRYLKQFQQATAAVPDAVVVLGCDNEISWANASAAQMLRIRWPEDHKQRLTHLVRDPGLGEFLHKEKSTSDAMEFVSPVNPELYLHVRVVAFGDDLRLFIARDVTRLHRLNEVRRDFVANVSHELRTPLTVVRGYVETLNDNLDRLPEAWRMCMQQLDAQTRRMQEIIDDLLLLSRLEEGETTAKTEVAVAELLAKIQEEAQALSGDKHHSFEFEADPELCIWGSPQELYSAFSNIVFNAVRYTPAGGMIKIRWYQDQDGAYMEVTDTGIGIPAHYIPRITERFFRVDKSRSRESGGTGLGLAIVKHVLNRHHAVLQIESKVDEGSTFRCAFSKEGIVLEAPVETTLPAPLAQ